MKSDPKTTHRSTPGGFSRALLIAVILFTLLSCADKKSAAKASSQADPSSPSSPAQDSAGAVSEKRAVLSYFEEPLSLARGGKEIEPSFGLELAAGDILTTGENGTCEIELPGIGTITVTYASRVSVDGIKAEERRAAISVLKGKVLSKIEKLAAPDSFTVRSGSVVCGVRGTVFAVKTEESGSCVLDVLEGTVSVFPESLVTEGLHPSSTLMGIEATPVDISSLPTVSAGKTITIKASAFAAADGAVKDVTAGDIAKVVDLARKAVPGARPIPADKKRALETFRDRVVRHREAGAVSQKTKESGYTCLIKPIDPPLETTDEGSFWPMTAPYTKSPAGKDPLGTMQESTHLISYNKQDKSAGTAKISGNGATFTVKKANPDDWVCNIGQVQPVPLKTGHLYALAFTAWSDVSPFVVIPALNEGGVDRDGDGEAYSMLTIYAPIPVSTTPARYTFLYQHRAKNTDSAIYTLTVGTTAGTAHVQDMAITELTETASVFSPTKGQLVANGNFARGFDGWWCQNRETNDTSVFAVEDGSLVYRATGFLTDGWHAQTGTRVALSKGAHYRLTLDAAIEGEGTFGVDLAENNRDENGDGNKLSGIAPWLRVKLIPGGWNRYSFDFKATSTARYGMLQLNFGLVKGTVRVDNVVLEELP